MDRPLAHSIRWLVEIQQQFHQLQQQLNKTVVFATHDIQEAFILASRVVWCSPGQLLVLEKHQPILKIKSTKRALSKLQPFAQVYNAAEEKNGRWI